MEGYENLLPETPSDSDTDQDEATELGDIAQVELVDEEAASSSHSKIVIFDGHPIAVPLQPPVISALNVTNSSNVTVGTTLITQNIHNSEIVTGHFLCLEFESTVNMNRFRCSLAVFLCWTLLVASSVACYLFIFIMPQHQSPLNIGLKTEWYLRRHDWQAMPAYHQEFLRLPVDYVIIGHAATKYCNDRLTCMAKVIAIQQSQLRRGYQDIGPNFLVGGGGWVYEGTGANVISSMNLVEWESNSITVMFLGNYIIDTPDQDQFDHLNTLFDVLVNENVLSPNYQLYGYCQMRPQTISPGPKLMKRLHIFPHWNSANDSACLPGIVYHNYT